MFLCGVNHIGSHPADAAGIAEQLRSWGFNMAGHDTPVELRDHMPFIHSVTFTRCAHYLPPERFAYDDVFDPLFQRRVADAVAQACDAVRKHPNLIGYTWTDTPQWDLNRARQTRGDDWVSAIRRLPPMAPGRCRYEAFLQQRHGTAAAMNRAYGLTGTSWRVDEPLDLNRPAVREDDETFLVEIARELYDTIGRAFRTHDPEALQFGERYKAHDHPPGVLRETTRHIDVLSIQPGPEVGPLPGPGRHERTFDRAYFDRLHTLVDKPILVCDHACSFRSADRPVTLWHAFDTPEEAGQACGDYLLAAAGTPYVVGYQRCQYRSVFHEERGLLKQGLLDERGEPFDAMVRPLADAIAKVTFPHDSAT